MEIDTLVLQSLFMVVPTVIGSAVGSLFTYFKTTKKQNDAIKTGMKLLIKTELRNMHTSICVNCEGCTIDDKADAGQLYEIYKGLGGNGTGVSMYEDIMQAKVTE